VFCIGFEIAMVCVASVKVKKYFSEIAC